MGSIELQNITVLYKGKKVLNDVSFKVEKGEYVALLGPTGAGPSFILKAIAGLIEIKSGSILIDGVDVTAFPPEDRNVGFVFEQFNLFPHLSVMDNLLFGPRMRSQDLEGKRQIALEVINMVRLDGRENAISRELSGGMQQRVGVARAVTSGAEILLLDQPYRALDAKIRAELRIEIREIAKNLGLTVLHSTHETQESMVVADRIVIFNKGRLLQFDQPETLFKNPNSKFIAQFLTEANVFTGICNSSSVQIGDINLAVNSEIEGDCHVIISQQRIILSLSELKGQNIFKGQIVTIRLLGEFVKFTVKLEKDWVIVVRELLSLKHKNLNQFQGKVCFIEIQPQDIKIFES